jgi:hypothetical protein
VLLLPWHPAISLLAGSFVTLREGLIYPICFSAPKKSSCHQEDGRQPFPVSHSDRRHAAPLRQSCLSGPSAVTTVIRAATRHTVDLVHLSSACRVKPLLHITAPYCDCCHGAHCLGKGLANQPQPSCQSHSATRLVNKVERDPSHAYLCLCHLWLLLCHKN